MMEGGKHYSCVSNQNFILSRNQHASQLPSQQANSANELWQNLVGIEAEPDFLSCTILRGLDGSNPVRLLGNSPRMVGDHDSQLERMGACDQLRSRNDRQRHTCRRISVADGEVLDR